MHRFVLCLIGLVVSVGSVHANDLALEVNCATCHVNQIVDIKATVTNEEELPIQGEVLFATIADGGLTTAIETSVTNSTGNTHILYTPTAIGDLMMTVEQEDGMSETLVITIVQ